MKRRNFLALSGLGVAAVGLGVRVSDVLKSEKRVWYVYGESRHIEKEYSIMTRKWDFKSSPFIHKVMHEIKWSEIKKDMEIYIEELNECKHGDAVLWNPYNNVFQCHKCGHQMDGPYITLGDGYVVTSENGDKVWGVNLVQKDSKIRKVLI